MTPLYSSLLGRLRSNLGLKLSLLLTLPTVTTAAYLIVQRAILFPAHALPTTWIDRVIPFQPGWVWAYLSLYLLMPIGPLLTCSRDALFDYTRGVLLYFALGLMCFVFFPIAGPRPPQAQGNWLYEELILMDRVYNCLPSLHAACAVFAVLYAEYASRDTQRHRLRALVLSIAWMWVVLILYSTVATRQHFAVDLPPGILLAVIAFRLTCSSRRTP